MKELSTLELSQLVGGTWTDCEVVIMHGNTADETWTDAMWEDWIVEFEKFCK